MGAIKLPLFFYPSNLPINLHDLKFEFVIIKMNNIIGVSEYNGCIILLKDFNSLYESICSKCVIRMSSYYRCNGEYSGCKAIIRKLLDKSECDDINKVINPKTLCHVGWEYMTIDSEYSLFEVSYFKNNLGKLLTDKPLYI